MTDRPFVASDTLPAQADIQPLDLAARRRALETAPVRAEHFVPWRGGYLETPVVEVPAEALIYRVANGRIVAELGERAAAQGRALADIAAEEATPEVQALLHDLLVTKAADPAGPVMQELARHGQQTEPLLVTHDGVVVNGNRRLAAMRELMARDPGRYAAFAVVRAARLSDEATAADLEFIEASLQMAPDVKLAYGWINRRMKLAHQSRVLGLSDRDIADAYRMEDPAQIQAEIEQLDLADAYLAWRDTPGRYELVAGLEELFTGLGAATEPLSVRMRDLWRRAGFVLIEGREILPGPLDRLFPFAPPAPGTLPVFGLRRWAEERGMLTPQEGAPAGPKSPAPPDEVVEDLDRLLRPGAALEDTAASLHGLLEQLRSEHLETRAPVVALKQLARARTAMAGIELGRFSPKQLRELSSEMTALQANVAQLLGETVRAPAGPTAPLPPAPPRPLWRVLRGKR